MRRLRGGIWPWVGLSLLVSVIAVVTVVVSTAHRTDQTATLAQANANLLQRVIEDELDSARTSVANCQLANRTGADLVRKAQASYQGLLVFRHTWAGKVAAESLPGSPLRALLPADRPMLDFLNALLHSTPRPSAFIPRDCSAYEHRVLTLEQQGAR